MTKANTRMLVHIVDDNLREVGKPVRAKTYSQEINYRGRMWGLNHISEDVKITDYKGTTHYYANINEADGTLHFLTPEKLNLIGTDNKPIDMCGKCGDRISIDARNQRDLLKRNTTATFWRIDNSYVLLLIVIGIGMIIALAFAFYLFGQVTALQNELRIYKPTSNNQGSSATSARLVLGAWAIN